MSTLKPKYNAAVSLTVSLNSLAHDANLLIGRQSTQIDNESDLAVDSLLGGVITTGSSSAAGVIEVWVWASWDRGTTRTASMGASDAGVTIATIGVKALMRIAESISHTDTSSRAYNFGPISVRQLFGGTMPDHWGVFVTHNTTAALNSSGHSIKYTPVQYDNV